VTEHQLLTVNDVCHATKLGRTTVYALVRSGELPVVRIGRSVRVRRETLDRWLESQEDVGQVAAQYFGG